MARNSRAYRERRFDAKRPVYVSKSFKGNGRNWQPGQYFDWHRMAISQRRVRQMFDAGKLKHDESDFEEQRVDNPGTQKVHTEVGPVEVQTPDELDDIEDMKELRDIANREGAKTTTSKTLQRKYIRENRQEQDGQSEVV